MIPPFIPEWKVQFDTKYFDEFEETKSFIWFVDFTYKQENDKDYRINKVTDLEVLIRYKKELEK